MWHCQFELDKNWIYLRSLKSWKILLIKTRTRSSLTLTPDATSFHNKSLETLQKHWSATLNQVALETPLIMSSHTPLKLCIPFFYCNSWAGGEHHMHATTFVHPLWINIRMPEKFLEQWEIPKNYVRWCIYKLYICISGINCCMQSYHPRRKKDIMSWFKRNEK